MQVLLSFLWCINLIFFYDYRLIIIEDLVRFQAKRFSSIPTYDIIL